MQTITRLVLQKRDKERVNVYLDGEFAFGLALPEAIHLKVGQQLDATEIDALEEKDGYHRAHARALDLLSRRPRSRVELERHLTRKEVPADVVERVTDRLVEAALLDDLAFAQYWIENRETFRPRGANAIRHELRQKGVDAKIIDEALVLVGLDELDGAYRVAVKQLSKLRAIEDRWQFQQKLAAYLGRRGFGWDVIRQVSEQLWQTRHDTDTD